ncbi:MAG: amidohydrolase family protein [Candidatus Binatia bacterium]
MSLAGIKVIDLDSHLVGDVDNWEHWIGDKWKPFLPRKLPTKPNERKLTLVGNRIMTGSEMGRHSREKPNWHRPEDLTPEGRVENLDKDGIDIAVLSPNSPALDLLWFAGDPELAAAYCRAQNNYMCHYASQQPERLKWAGVIPMQDRDEAIKELHRTIEMGMKGLNLKAVPVKNREWSDSYYDPVYKELEKLKVPIIIHDTKTASLGQDRFADNFFFSHMVGRVFEGMVCCMVFLCGGVLERFPQLKIVALEAGASHMPWWLARMDEHFEKLPHLVPWLKKKPSDYFKCQMFVGCEPFEDALFEWAIELLGDGNLVLATDTPHWDSAKPGEVTKPIIESGRISEKSKRKILGENAMALLGLS